jgi:hypothetical protein
MICHGGLLAALPSSNLEVKNCGEGQLSGGARRSGCVQRPLYTKRPKVVSTETAVVSGY